jgi:hypothetical protein
MIPNGRLLFKNADSRFQTKVHTNARAINKYFCPVAAHGYETFPLVPKE